MPRTLLSDKFSYLIGVSILMYALLYYFHGFLVYYSDTVETVPYALWMADNSLFPKDFHIQNLSKIFPNERWSISYLLHFFPDSISLVSHILHAFFSVILISGMLRLADILLKNIEWSVLAVFLCLFTLYNINVGANELYYNMFVASLASKAFAVWGIVFFVKKNYSLSSIAVVVSSFLHPLVGLQIFLLLSAVLFWTKVPWKHRETILFYFIYLCTAGVWIFFILRAQGPKMVGDYTFFEIVKFRIAHHFFPGSFPKSHLLLHVGLYAVAMYHFYKKSYVLFLFFLIAIVGCLVYLLGLSMEWEIVLSSQWMKVNIWLKFLGIIGCLAFCQSMLERRYHRIFFLVVFIIGLILALFKFKPKYDKAIPLDLYSYISFKTPENASFLVPPGLLDFKAYTLRSSYFDFKTMLHHKPEIYEWARRFEEVYPMKISDRNFDENIFQTVKHGYMKKTTILTNPDIDYFIIPQEQLRSDLIEELEKQELKSLFSDDQFNLYGK